jgi:hypothetical protein
MCNDNDQEFTESQILLGKGKFEIQYETVLPKFLHRNTYGTLNTNLLQIPIYFEFSAYKFSSNK